MPAEAARPAEPGRTGELVELELRLLAFERDWTGRVGAKDAAIRAEFALSPARYHQLLHALIERPAALAHDPLLVRRLQRLRDTRARARASRGFRTETER